MRKIAVTYPCPNFFINTTFCLFYCQLDRGVNSSLPPLLLSFLPPDVLAGAGGSSLLATERGLKNLLTAANRWAGAGLSQWVN